MRVVVTATTIKACQRYMAAKAGLETSEKKTMTMSDIHLAAGSAFLRHCKIFFESGDAPDSLTIEMLLNKSANVKYKGDEIWNLYLEIKRDIMNIFTPLWNSKLDENGKIPSGKTKEDLKSECLNDLWEQKETERVTKLMQQLENGGEGSSSKTRAKTEKQPRPDDWAPLSWMAFVELGAPAETPQVQLLAPTGNGPRKTNDATQAGAAPMTTMSRAEQRKKADQERAEKRVKEREASKLQFITTLVESITKVRANVMEPTATIGPVSAPTSPTLTGPSTGSSPSPKNTGVPLEELKMQKRKARREELQLLLELADDDEKESVKAVLKAFLRDPEIDTAVPVPVHEMPKMRALNEMELGMEPVAPPEKEAGPGNEAENKRKADGAEDAEMPKKRSARAGAGNLYEQLKKG